VRIKQHGRAARATGTLACVLIGALLVTACGNAAPANGPPSTEAPGTPVAAPLSTRAAPPTQAGLDCQALANAAFDLNSSEPSMVMLAGSGGSAVNRLDSPSYIDTAKLRADLKLLAMLPDPTDAAEIAMMGKPSDAIPQFVQLLDLIDAGAQAAAGVTPSTARGQQLLGFFGAKLIQMSTALSAAMGNACPGASPNTAGLQPAGGPATALPAGYQIGQTAPVGALLVTLDRVATISAGVPSPGNRFVFAYFTVQNKGQASFQINTLSGTHWEDAKGQQFFTDPFSVALDPNTTNFDGGIAAGATQSGAIGYQLPRDAGDLVWVFADSGPNRAVFAVKASDVATVGTPVTEATADALRTGAAATQTAFVTMALGAVATEAAAETAGLPPPVDTPDAPDIADSPTVAP